VKSILFVDDHQVLARLSCEILEMQGYRAVGAHSGEEALQKFQDDQFDVLVTDMRLGAMSGLELARKLHEQHPEIPVILITGYEPVDFGADAVACLQKEDLFPALLDKIKSLLGETGEEPEIAKTA
jgi:CheY-like chemotaxis protein